MANVVTDRRPSAVDLSLGQRLRAVRPPRWWQEIGLIAVVYYLYSAVRNAVPSHEVAASHRASTLLSWERTLHVDGEQRLNHFVSTATIGHVHLLAYVCDYYYSTLHFIVTIGVLVWLYRSHPLRYRSIRSVLIITNLIALVGFWFYSLEPPRMLTGYVDTVVHFHTWGSLADPSIAQHSNQYAAMPSLHIGWALWCAAAIVTLARRRWVRVLGAIYPLATLFVIVGTANHYVLDAVGGAVALALAVVVHRLLAGRTAYQPHPDLVPVIDREPELVTA